VILIDPGSILLVRHAERGDIPEGSDGDEVPLTARGRSDASDFGRRLGIALDGKGPGLAGASSPIGRCRETARLALEGALSRERVRPSKDFLMSYVRDEAAAAAALRADGYEKALYEFIGRGSYPGFLGLDEGSRGLLGSLREAARGRSLVCVSHDVVILPFLAFFCPGDIERLEGDWVGYLEGVLIDPYGGMRRFRPHELA
jgi:hypothetical protein